MNRYIFVKSAYHTIDSNYFKYKNKVIVFFILKKMVCVSYNLCHPEQPKGVEESINPRYTE